MTFPWLQRLLFLASYAGYKLILPLELRRHRLAFWGYEARYTFAKFRAPAANRPYAGPHRELTTCFGRFRIRPGTADAAAVSPAFERRDMNRLLRLLRGLTGEGKRVLFLDIGADLGSYSVAVGNRIPAGGCDLWAFEPVPDSRALLEENLALNGLTERVRVLPYAASNTDDDHAVMRQSLRDPGSSSMVHALDPAGCREVPIVTRRLDGLLLATAGAYDAVVCKMDVEGAEPWVLEGAEAFLAAVPEVHLLVEDFIEPAVVTWLEAHGWVCAAKVTAYNSWWTRAAPGPERPR